MVILKNQSQIFQSHDFVESFLKSKEPDCTLYSEEGMKYNIHKEIFYQTQFMRNIFESSNTICCKEKEIFCPCSGNELESMVNFLYNGRASSLKVTDIAKILDNLTRIFGFPENFNPTSSNQAFHGGQNCSNEIGAVTKNETDKEGDY